MYQIYLQNFNFNKFYHTFLALYFDIPSMQFESEALLSSDKYFFHFSLNNRFY